MKRILTILALSLLCLTSNAQLLWKISGNGIKKPSYIVGSHHGCPFTYCDSIPGLMKELLPKQSTLFVVGAGHLPGEKGMINLLREAGYKGKPVKK